MQILKKTKLIGVVLVWLVYPATVAYADHFDDQINAIKSQVTQYQNQAADLHNQADTLINQVGIINAQQAEVRAQISGTQFKLDQLSQSIADNQQKIDNQKDALATNLRSAYLESTITPLEMVASSKSISDFVDKQQYRDVLNNQIQESLKSVKQLKEQLDAQKVETTRTLGDQTNMQSQLITQEQQKNKLIADTQGQEANYQQVIKQQNDNITKLRAEQAAANLKWSGGHVNFQARGGGYPSFWADLAMDSTADDWGMYNRECVSYAAFRVAASGRHMPYWGGVGNANQWPSNAQAAGIPVSNVPKAGDVAIWMAGYYGHAMYVESVNGDGSIIISEYNYDWSGRYSQRMISSGTLQAQGLRFIHF
ncbi:MAG TPA: CHAP domain-containing protein [Patescibacteria group bacterium]|jgi:surface antigen|nr:CHAP domain-containing protein [Patescibacteria group bacterium]